MIYPTKTCKYDVGVWCANFHEIEARLNSLEENGGVPGETDESSCKWKLVSDGTTQTIIKGSNYEVEPIIKYIIPTEAGEMSFSDTASFSAYTTTWKDHPSDAGNAVELYVAKSHTYKFTKNISVYVLESTSYSVLKKEINRLSEEIANLKQNSVASEV